MVSRAKKQVVIGDGAVWIWNLTDQHFPGAIQIVDLYDARQHLWELSAKLFPNDEQGRKRWMARCLKQLDRGKIEAVVKTLRELRSLNSELAKIVHNEADYFTLTPHACAIPPSALRASSSVLVSSKPVAKP